MNLSILKKLLPGLLPLFVFILADELWGTREGLAVAVVFGMGELAFYYFRHKKLDGFILLDTALLIALGAVSIILDNDIFFKVKPALIEGILLAVIGFSLWGRRNLMMDMTRKYLGEIKLDEVQQKRMRTNMAAMFSITAFHILLILWSAWFMSDAAWAFISGGLFYIFFGAYFGVIWLSGLLKQRKYKKEELFPIVDEEGNVLGTAPRSVCHDGKSKLLHPVVHLHLFNKKGELYLQKRSATKDIQPGKWDTSVGGHISPGEKVEDALAREAGEELGLKEFNPQFINKYVWESAREKELVFSFITVDDYIPVINKEEIDEGRFWNIREISSKTGMDIFTPNFEHEFTILKKYLTKNMNP